VEDVVSDHARSPLRLPQQDLDHITRSVGPLWEDFRDQSIFLTGGTGFVGKWLLESLLWAADTLDLGLRVVVLTRHPARLRTDAPHLADHPATTLFTGNAVDFPFPEGRFPFIVHAAAEGTMAADAEHPLSSFDADVDGFRRVLEFARQHGVRRFLFTSSGAVYGKQPVEMTHIPEEYAGAPSTMDAKSAYGQAKRTAEFMGTMYGRVYGFDAMIARLFAFVGPHLPLEGQYAAGNFIRDALRGGPVRITGDGTPYRSYLYASDLVIWLWTILLRGKAAYPYNVGSSQELTIYDLARTVVRVTAPATSIETAKKPLPGVPSERYVPQTRRAEHELGLRAVVPIDQAISQTAMWHRSRSSE
jgi:nucleoside-diphosphate-sugar epimerase